MTYLHTLLLTIWASIITLGWLKVVIAVVIIALLTRAQNLLGLLGALLFIAYLAGWL